MNDRKEGFTDIVRETGRSAWLAGLGTAVTIEEGAERLLHNTRKELKDNVTRIAREAEEGFQRLVERGRTFQQEHRSIRVAVPDVFSEAGEAAEAWMARTRQRTEAVIRSTAEQVMHRLKMPTRDEIQALTERIERLQAEVEALRKEGLRPSA